jgi:hypothetical protein
MESGPRAHISIDDQLRNNLGLPGSNRKNCWSNSKKRNPNHNGSSNSIESCSDQSGNGSGTVEAECRGLANRPAQNATGSARRQERPRQSQRCATAYGAPDPTVRARRLPRSIRHAQRGCPAPLLRRPASRRIAHPVVVGQQSAARNAVRSRGTLPPQRRQR